MKKKGRKKKKKDESVIVSVQQVSKEKVDYSCS